MNKRGLHGQRLVALFGVGCVLFNYPLIAIFSNDGMIWGVPVLYAYVFSVWTLLIALMTSVVARR